jgi:hypothetical protein
MGYNSPRIFSYPTLLFSGRCFLRSAAKALLGNVFVSLMPDFNDLSASPLITPFT